MDIDRYGFIIVLKPKHNGGDVALVFPHFIYISVHEVACDRHINVDCQRL